MDKINEAVFYPEVMKIGGSFGFTIPKDVVDLITVEEGDKLKVNIIIVKKKGDSNGN